MIRLEKAVALLACVGALALDWTGASQAAEPGCDPAKVATLYPALAGKTLTLVMTGTNTPFSFRNPQDPSKLEGFFPDLAATVSACIGVPVTLKTADFSGLVASVTSGQSDALWDELYYTPERAKAVDYVIFMSARSGIYVTKGNPKGIKSLDDLCGKSAVGLIGTIEIEKLRNLSERCVASKHPAIEVTTGIDRPGALNLMKTGRADAYMGIATAPQYDPPDLERAFVFLSGIKVGVATAKGNKPLQTAIFDAIKALRADGTEAKLDAKYGLGSVPLPEEIVTQ